MSTPFDMLQRLSALIDEEAAALNSGNLAVIKDYQFPQSYVLLELSRAGLKFFRYRRPRQRLSLRTCASVWPRMRGCWGDISKQCTN